jgi:predicted dehydrogenase
VAVKNIGIILNGVTGRMGTNQHLLRSIMAIREEGGVQIDSGDYVYPEPVMLVGRNINKLETLSSITGLQNISTDLGACLANSNYDIYFDAQTTDRRVEAVGKAIEAGKSVYCEKPTATTLKNAIFLYQKAKAAGVKNGVVQDKLWLPGIQKLKTLIESGFFGEILAIRGEFGYWVFDGKIQPAQRPSWNYRKEDGGGIMLDMFTHWRYVIDNLFGDISRVLSLGATHLGSRIDEQGKEYNCTADDAAYALFELKNGIICQFNSSWAVRVRRDDLLTIQVDGTKGSAVAGLRKCWIQNDISTPRPVWNPDEDSKLVYYDHWQEMPDVLTYDNAFRAQWELFLKHVVTDAPFPWDLYAGAKGVQLAELGMESWKSQKWMHVTELR